MVIRGRILEHLEGNQAMMQQDPAKVKFRASVNDGEYEEVVTLHQLLDKLESDLTEEGIWKFKRIAGHQGPLRPNHPSYKGSSYNVLVEWETGETTYEPLNMMAADDPVSCAIYAKEKGLLDRPGWKQFRKITKRQKKLVRMLNQAKLKSFCTTVIYKYGYKVPRNHDQAVAIDKEMGNTHWQDAEKLSIR